MTSHTKRRSAASTAMYEKGHVEGQQVILDLLAQPAKIIQQELSHEYLTPPLRNALDSLRDILSIEP